ncbi:hypothetical protein NP493_151g04001 [Ridgeia piscesae]|uniref:Uncharacterized protein n=1 Tax=Ridgeia piscesae TaxID=27915 RepID=A0AAD9P4J6_RIDPI|nr:hypothetical protein NP493_151g04001 [Ridgeia piscesae]
MKRVGDQLLISCLATRRSYQLLCREQKWIGTVGVCPLYTSNANIDELKTDGIGVPIGLMVAIVAAIALVTGTCIVMAGLVILKRRRLARARAHVTVVDTSYSAACQQRSTLHEQQYSGSSAKSTPNEYDYSMEMRPLPSVPASEKDLSKRQSGTGPADDMLVS